MLWSLLIACAPLHRYPDGTGIEGQLEREVVALQLKVQELEAGGARAGAEEETDPLLTELVQIFSGSDVMVEATDAGPLLLVPSAAVFAEAYPPRLRDESAMVFDLLATAMGQHPTYEAVVTGHTSDRPPPSPRRGQPAIDHWLLGAAQAHAFVTQLREAHGVTGARLVVSSRGDSHPIASNDLPSGQDDNERIEVLLRRSP